MSFGQKQAFEPKKTEKGTELPLMNLKGKAYLEVKYRLVWFREVFPAGSIQTEVREEGDVATARATIAVPVDGNYVVLATGHKKETKANFSDNFEKAETGAIGRALAAAGFGTQFEPEFDEGERIVDAPVEKKTRSVPSNRSGGTKVHGSQEAPASGEKASEGTAANSAKQVAGANPELRVVTSREDQSAANEQDDEAYIKGRITAAAQEVISIRRSKTQAELKQYLKEKYGVEKKDDLNLEQAKELLSYLESLPFVAKEAK